MPDVDEATFRRVLKERWGVERAFDDFEYWWRSYGESDPAEQETEEDSEDDNFAYHSPHELEDDADGDIVEDMTT